MQMTCAEKPVICSNRIYLRRHIMIKGRFTEYILTGKKRSTIRLGCVIPRYKEVFIHGGGRPVAKAMITSVVYKRVCQLTEEDAHRDGYSSVEELLKDLEKVYNRKIAPSDVVTIIEFEVIKSLLDLSMQDIYMGLSPADIASLAYRYLEKELSKDELRIIDAVIKHGSIREASLKLYGSLNKRWIIRRTLRNCLRILIEKGIIGNAVKE
ncbi:ASCH domain-containing protein [Desulfurococcus sp.]